MVNLIKTGVKADYELPAVLSRRVQVKSAEEEAKALKVLKEYLEVGAVVEVAPSVAAHLLPWFLIEKLTPTGQTVRLISDARDFNTYF